MRNDSHSARVAIGQIERRRGTVAVAGRADARNALCLERRDDIVNIRLPHIFAVIHDPCADVKLARRAECIFGNRIVVQVVRDDGPVTIAREVIREELNRSQ